MKIGPAQGLADLHRLLYKMGLMSTDTIHNIIDDITVRVLKAEILENSSNYSGFCREDLASPAHGLEDE